MSSKGKSLGWVVTAYLFALGAALAAGTLLAGRHPLWVTLWADIAGTVVVFAFSVWRKNASIYDPYWSVAPPLILVYWIGSGQGGDLSARQILVLFLVTAWAVRLTGNWVDRWSGLGEEDFRYRDLRARHGRWYPAVNFFGIHLLPTLLVLAACLPLYPALARPGQPIGWLDFLAVVVTAGAIAIEAAADAQLRRFRRHGGSGEYLSSGLWALSRHPNYFGELGFWWGLYLFGLAADPSWWWSVIGPLAMTALFWFVSVPLMESRMRERYPGYRRERAGVPRLVLWPGRR